MERISCTVGLCEGSVPQLQVARPSPLGTESVSPSPEDGQTLGCLTDRARPGDSVSVTEGAALLLAAASL